MSMWCWYIVDVCSHGDMCVHMSAYVSIWERCTHPFGQVCLEAWTWYQESYPFILLFQTVAQTQNLQMWLVSLGSLLRAPPFWGGNYRLAAIPTQHLSGFWVSEFWASCWPGMHYSCWTISSPYTLLLSLHPIGLNYIPTLPSFQSTTSLWREGWGKWEWMVGSTSSLYIPFTAPFPVTPPTIFPPLPLLSSSDWVGAPWDFPSTNLALQVSARLGISSSIEVRQGGPVGRTYSTAFGIALLQLLRTHVKVKPHICYIWSGRPRSSCVCSLVGGESPKDPG